MGNGKLNKYNTVILDGSMEQDIATAAELIIQGENVALPTETVYGLAADAGNEAAINKIFIAKNRPNNHPLILHISDADYLPKIAKNITPNILKIAENLWPGPVTMLLMKRDNILDSITAGSEKIAVRVPANDIFRAVMKKSGRFLVAPSANLYTKLSPTAAEHVHSSLGGRIAAIVDGGRCSVGIESTIIDMTMTVPTILRKGPVTGKNITDIINEEVNILDTHDIAISGNKKKHYQPNTPTYLMTKSEILNLTSKSSNNIILHYSNTDIFSNIAADKKKISANSSQYCYEIYNLLHQLDCQNYNKIIIEKPLSDDREWQAILDRLCRAVYS